MFPGQSDEEAAAAATKKQPKQRVGKRKAVDEEEEEESSASSSGDSSLVPLSGSVALEREESVTRLGGSMSALDAPQRPPSPRS